jgi:hypothetical protein
MLTVMACMPQTMLFYDQLVLGLVARGWKQAAAFAVLSWLPFAAIPVLAPVANSLAEYSDITAQLIVWLYYLPCLAVVLLRPNRDDAHPIIAGTKDRAPVPPPPPTPALAPVLRAGRNGVHGSIISAPNSASLNCRS